MTDQEALKIKNVLDVTDPLKGKERRRQLITKIRESLRQFQDAYRERRERLLEINAIYRNKSYMDRNKAGWQTKIFLPLPFNAIEKRTSTIHQALWGNRLGSPFTAIGATPEDHKFAESAEAVLNNTVNRIGFYGTSEEVIRSTCKYGLGVYRYGWQRRKQEKLWREVVREKDGKVKRDEFRRPSYNYVKKTYNINQPYVRSVDIVDHFGWDPTAKTLDPWQCEWVFELAEESKEYIYEQESRNYYEKGTFDKLKLKDPHGFNEWLALDAKEPQIRRDEGVQDNVFRPVLNKYIVCHWYGWFDVDGDGMREFVYAAVILDNDLVLCARENAEGEYPYVDVHHSRSLHSMTSWGVVDPVVELVYGINEFLNQRGDSIKLKLHPQFLINVDKILEDHAYVSSPGAFHPFAAGDNPVNDAMQVLQFQNMEFLGVEEEERLINMFRETTGNTNIQQAVNSIDRTPATTLISLLNQEQSGNAMIINGILDRHGVLGSRMLKQIQLYGDEEFIIRTAGRRGLEFRTESLENILGDYDIRVTTSTFFGNKEIELQQLIQLRPLWAEAQHIDIVEVDRSIVRNILPKLEDKIMRVPGEPMSIMDELKLFLYGQGESVKLSEEEDLASLQVKFRSHKSFKSTAVYRQLDAQTKEEFEIHLGRIENRISELETQQQLQAAEAAKVQTTLNPEAGPQGNLRNTGSPNNRTLGNLARPKFNNQQL